MLVYAHEKHIMHLGNIHIPFRKWQRNIMGDGFSTVIKTEQDGRLKKAPLYSRYSQILPSKGLRSL